MNPRLVSGWLAGMVLGPLVIMTLYLTLSRRPTRWSTGASDWLALLFSVAMGYFCLGKLPLPSRGRALLFLLYIPAVVAGLCLYTLYFVGAVFGDWL